MTLWALLPFAVYLWSLQMVAKEKFTISYPFNLPLRNLLPTPTKPLQLNNIRKQKLQILILLCTLMKPAEDIGKRNVVNTQKKKYVSGCRISISTFELYSQNDGEEVGAEASKGDIFRGSCSRQYTCQNSSQFGHRIERMKCSLVAWGLRWRKILWKIHLWEVLRVYSCPLTIVIRLYYIIKAKFLSIGCSNDGPIHPKW